eukprot:443434_1
MMNYLYRSVACLQPIVGRNNRCNHCQAYPRHAWTGGSFVASLCTNQKPRPGSIIGRLINDEYNTIGRENLELDPLLVAYQTMNIIWIQMGRILLWSVSNVWVYLPRIG